MVKILTGDYEHDAEERSVGALRKKWSTTDLNLCEITMQLFEAVDPDEYSFCCYGDDEVIGFHIIRDGIVHYHAPVLDDSIESIPAKVGDKIVFYYQHICESSRCYFQIDISAHDTMNMVCCKVVEDPSS